MLILLMNLFLQLTINKHNNLEKYQGHLRGVRIVVITPGCGPGNRSSILRRLTILSAIASSRY